MFQTDTEFEDMKMPKESSEVDWNAFTARTKADRQYFDYTIRF